MKLDSVPTVVTTLLISHKKSFFSGNLCSVQLKKWLAWNQYLNLPVLFLNNTNKYNLHVQYDTKPYIQTPAAAIHKSSAASVNQIATTANPLLFQLHTTAAPYVQYLSSKRAKGFLHVCGLCLGWNKPPNQWFALWIVVPLISRPAGGMWCVHYDRMNTVTKEQWLTPFMNTVNIVHVMKQI